jgi:hypothetical protein
MKKIVLTLVAGGLVLAFLPASATAQTLCFRTGTGLTFELVAESVSPNTFRISGELLSSGAPLDGTAVRNGPNVQVGVGIVQASASANAVVWQFDLSASTLDGTGFFRWYDGSNQSPAPTSVNNVACPPASQVEAVLDRAGAGLR